MQEAETIQVLGRGTNVDFTIDDNVPFEIAERSLREYLEVCRGLYSSGTVSVNVGRRILVPDQLTAIKEILDQETGLTVTRYWCAPEILQKALAGPPTARSVLAPIDPISGNASQVSEAELGGQKEAAVDDFGALSNDQAGSSPEGCQAQEVDDRQMVMALFDQEGPQTKSKESEGPVALPPGVNPDGGQETGVEPKSESSESGETGGESAAAIDVSPSRPQPEAEHRAEIGDQSEAVLAGVNETEEADENQSSPQRELPESEVPPWLRRGNEALIVKATCRSGEVIQYPGDVVVYGDVNPGAEIIAGGDIVVLGALRGMARAGADDNTKATIFALNLESHRMQIGRHVGEAPEDVKQAKSDSRVVAPKIAYLRRGSVFVVPFTRRREDYQGGILYEG
jgi:septum formation inhibitor MinC